MKLNRLVHIKNVTSTIERIKLKVEWETEGLEYLPERAYIIKFNTIKGRPMEDVNATQESMGFYFTRPIKYEVEITPKIDFRLEEDILDIIPGKITLNAKDKKPEKAPTNVTIMKGNIKKFYVQFQPVPVEELWGKDEGCEARLCERPVPRPKCYAIGKGVPQWGSIELEVPRYNKRYYIQVACLTSAGRGPWSKWIDHLIEGTETLPTHVKLYCEIAQTFLQEGPTSIPEEMVITKEKNLREINIGLSPGFKFDLNCYLYGINVTFRGDFSVTDSTDEVCYSVLSPGFLITYGFALVVVICIILLLTYKSRSGRGRGPVSFITFFSVSSEQHFAFAFLGCHSDEININSQGND
ncbi:hypothetical protein Q1695_008152 [Nippostrongylus brasiliensis]|nr:hypothetical protein Q1695_008152 [Nippostrongylus brasiliensis]